MNGRFLSVGPLQYGTEGVMKAVAVERNGLYGALVRNVAQCNCCALGAALLLFGCSSCVVGFIRTRRVHILAFLAVARGSVNGLGNWRKRCSFRLNKGQRASTKPLLAHLLLSGRCQTSPKHHLPIVAVLGCNGQQIAIGPSFAAPRKRKDFSLPRTDCRIILTSGSGAQLAPCPSVEGSRSTAKPWKNGWFQ